jgi:hypothetical protein
MKLLLTTILLCFCLSGFSQYNFTIKANSTSLSGKKIYFELYNNNNFIPLRYDSLTFENGQLRIEGQLDQFSRFARFDIKVVWFGPYGLYFRFHKRHFENAFHL